MHIVQFCPPTEFYTPTAGGAVTTIIMNSTAELIRRGHRVSVLAPVGDDPYNVGEVYPVRPAIRRYLKPHQRLASKLIGPFTRWGRRYYDQYARTVTRAVRRLPTPPDAIITHNDPSGPRLARHAAPDVPAFHWMHNEPDVTIAETLEHVVRYFACSDFVRDSAAGKGLPSDRVATVLYGVESDRFHPRPDYLDPSDPLRVVYVGRIHPTKGVDLVVKAVARLRAQGVAVELTIVGSKWWFGHERAARDPYYRELTELVEATPGVEHLGHVDRHTVPEVIRAHDVVCVPSVWEEPAGLVNLEGMASGCALVATRRGGIPQLAGDAAMLVEPEVDAFVEALGQLAADPAKLREHKRRAVEHAATFTWAATAERLESLIGTSRTPTNV